MGAYIVRRIFLAVIVLVGMSLFTFIISHAIPGDPARLASGVHAKAEQVESLRRQMGLDKPLPVQYLIYMKGLLRGDMGVSVMTRRPVADELFQYLPATVELSVFALLISVIAGVFLGVVSAVRRNSVIDHFLRVFSLIGASIPLFWLGLLFLILFYKQFNILPIGGRIGIELNPPTKITGLYILDSILSGDWLALKSSIAHIILPSITLGYSSMGIFTRMARSCVLEVLGTDYIRTARAKGLEENIVIYKHALRNAVLPLITLVGLQCAYLLGGTVLAETIFSWPGLGSYSVTSITNLNFPGIMGVTLTITTIFVAINLITDLCYAIADPRIVYK